MSHCTQTMSGSATAQDSIGSSTQGSFRVYGHCGLWLLPHLGPLRRRWHSRPQSWKTLNTGLCACLGAPGHLLPPFSAKKWAGEAERAGNYPGWSDHAIPEESCLACVGVEAGPCLRIIKTGMWLQIHSLTLSKKSWSVLGSTPNSPCLPSQANLCFPLKNILMVSCFLQLSDVQKFHLFFKVPKSECL